MATEIRPMAPEDIPAALALWQGTPGICLREDDAPGPLAAFLRRNPGCSFVADADGRLVGAALGGHDGRRGALYHVAVHPDHRRGGLGTRLVQACLAAIRADGVDRVHCFVLAANADGLAFWRQLGANERVELAMLTFAGGGCA